MTRVDGPRAVVTPPVIVESAIAAPQSNVPASAPVDSYQGPRSTKAMVPADQRPILLYNGDCSVCRKISSWVINSDDPSHGGRQAIDERPIGYDPEALLAINPNLDIWKVYEEITLVMPSGEIKTGGEAIAEVLRRLPSTQRAAQLLDLDIGGIKPFQKLLDLSYYILDRLRPALGCESCGTPVPWWGKPVEWAFKGYNALFGKPKDAPPSPPSV